MTARWVFPSTGGGEQKGLNDPGIEFFRSSGSLARETVQNSIDASDEKGAPVRVQFSLLQLKVTGFPGAAQLRDIIARCETHVLGYCKTDEERRDGGQAFFDRARELLDQSTFPVLKISDFNTTGLTGDDADQGSHWYRLLRTQGTARRHGKKGGTFGIGQRAPFAFSDLRTVFYGTRTATNGVRVIGKSILCSFKDEKDDVRQPIGYFGIEHGCGVDGLSDKSGYPQLFKRAAPGTDLYILGYTRPRWRHTLATQLIRHFFAAIESGRLEVELIEDGTKPVEISAKTISAVVDRLMAEDEEYRKANGDADPDGDELAATKFYLKALREKPTTAELKRLGEVTLYVTLGENAPAKVAFMRSPRILVSDYNPSGFKGYAGVFLCTSDQGNSFLASMEDPTHTKWESDRVADGAAVVRDIRKFVKDTLAEVVGAAQKAEEDIPDLDEYLPDDTKDAEGTPGGEGDNGGAQGRSGTKVPVSLDVTEGKKRPESATPAPGEGEQPGTGGGGNAGKKTGKKAKGKKKAGKHPAGGSGENRVSDSDLRWRSYYEAKNDALVLVITPSVDGKTSLRLAEMGEDCGYEPVIESADDIDLDEPLTVSKGTITGVELTAGEPKRIRVKLVGTNRVALSVGVANG